MNDARGARVVGDQGAQIDSRWAAGIRARELGVDVGADLVAPTADGRPAMDAQLFRCEATRRQTLDRPLGDARGSASPAGVEDRRRARGMGDEDGNAVGDRDGHRRTPGEREMAVGRVGAKPTSPTHFVLEHLHAVHLRRGGEPSASEPRSQGTPPRHDVANRLVGVCAERTGLAAGGERSDTQLGEGFYDLGLEDRGPR